TIHPTKPRTTTTRRAIGSTTVTGDRYHKHSTQNLAVRATDSPVDEERLQPAYAVAAIDWCSLPIERTLVNVASRQPYPARRPKHSPDKGRITSIASKRGPRI